MNERVKDRSDLERERTTAALERRIADATSERSSRPPDSIDPSTGRLNEPDKSPTGVVEAFNPMPFVMRPAVRATYRVRGELMERTYDVASPTEALTRMATDEPGAYDITVERIEVPIAD